MEKCPFHPNTFSPPCNNCMFLCNGGCAIQLSAYAHDAFETSKDIKNKLDSLEDDIDTIKRRLSQ